MKCILRTPEKTLFDAEADRVSGSTEYGSVEIFPGHTALSATIDFSVLEIQHGDTKESFLAKQGFLHTNPDDDVLMILVQTAEKKEEVDVKSLKEYKDFILEKLAKKEDLSPYQLRHLEESQSAVEKMLEMTK
jgi:F0F1-type ATP synthase epsilon subunit